MSDASIPATRCAARVAIDWGTTNRRVFGLDAAGTILWSRHDEAGVGRLSPPDLLAALHEVRLATSGDIVAAGMIGSNRGLANVPYVSAPAGVDDLARGALRYSDGLVILPGVANRTGDPADVMRGEEVQILGAIAAGLAPADAIFCQPGTHNKWVTVEGGRISRIRTTMVGELFGLLRDYSVLAEMLRGQAGCDDRFREGLARGLAGDDPLAALFETRAAVMLGRRRADSGASFVSGLLIGLDLRAQDLTATGPIALIADTRLAPIYAEAIALAGGSCHVIDSDTAFVAGIHQIRSRMA